MHGSVHSRAGRPAPPRVGSARRQVGNNDSGLGAILGVIFVAVVVLVAVAGIVRS